MRWFHHDPEDGITFHDTAEQAKAAGERAMDDWRDHAGDGWPENITDVCWGAIHAHATEVSRLEIPEGIDVNDDGMGSDGVDYSEITNSEWDYIVNYKLVDEPPAFMLVSGGKLEPESQKKVQDLLASKGVHNVMVMEVETTFNQGDMDSAVDEEAKRIAALLCKDCASGRARSISTLLGGTPRWMHMTGPASGRECEVAVMWGEARG